MDTLKINALAREIIKRKILSDGDFNFTIQVPDDAPHVVEARVTGYTIDVASGDIYLSGASVMYFDRTIVYNAVGVLHIQDDLEIAINEQCERIKSIWINVFVEGEKERIAFPLHSILIHRKIIGEQYPTYTKFELSEIDYNKEEV